MTKQELEEKLLTPLKGKRKVLILTHDNPDPDSIAAAFGLRYILKKTLGITAVIAYGGIIGRVENQSMVKLLHIDMVSVTDVSFRNFSVVALVDCQPHTGNVSLPSGINPGIVIDHHPLRKSSEKADFVDVRKGFGSTCTIITQYIRHLNLPMDKEVATALFYGIRSDTRDLARESSDIDVRASIFLFPFVLQKKLSRIEHPEKPKEYFVKLYSVLSNARIHGDVALARVDLIGWPEMIGEFADELIQMEGIRWCMCYGRHNGSLIFSIRTTRPSYMAGCWPTRSATDWAGGRPRDLCRGQDRSGTGPQEGQGPRRHPPEAFSEGDLPPRRRARAADIKGHGRDQAAVRGQARLSRHQPLACGLHSPPCPCPPPRSPCPRPWTCPCTLSGQCPLSPRHRGGS
jgi:nanoRNase/pAp phosphatase (c-di-AMP/oligoRNAs hydrolase)